MVDRLPHSILSERQVLGAMMLSSSVIADVLPLLVPDDFYKPTHKRMYEQIALRYGRGDEVTLPLIAADLEGVIDPRDLLGMQSEVASLTGAVTHARTVANLSSVRSICMIAVDVAEAAKDATEPFDLLDMASTRLSHVPVPIRTFEMKNVESFMEHDDTYEWAIPDVLEFGDRAIIVAPEGVGKSMFLRQIAVMSSQGIHPFTEKQMDPLRVLLLDLENGEKLTRRKIRPIWLKARQSAGDVYDADRLSIQCIPEGLNVLARVDRDTLEGMCASFRPQLICAGPLYKLFDTPHGSKDSTGGETIAKDTVRVLDSLRRRYGFALMLEHHAPKGTGGRRDLNPFGSAVWLRWPEFGLALEKSYEHGDNMFQLTHFRGPRDERDWPSLLMKGGDWPWSVIE